MELPQTEYDVLTCLGKEPESIGIPALAAKLGLDQSPVMAACTELRQRELLRIDEVSYDELSLGKEGQLFAETPLPERTVVGVLAAQGGAWQLTEVPSHCDLNAGQVGQSLRWLNQRGWARKENNQNLPRQQSNQFPTIINHPCFAGFTSKEYCDGDCGQDG